MNPTGQALKLRIQLGQSKSGPCAACKANQRAAANGSSVRIPPLHPNCKCGDNLGSALNSALRGRQQPNQHTYKRPR